MSESQSKDFLNTSCIVEGVRDKIRNFNNNISTTFVPAKDVYKAGGGSGLLGLGIGGAGMYAALRKNTSNDNSEAIQSLRDKLTSIFNDNDNNHES
jgi:hypothetical protein